MSPGRPVLLAGLLGLALAGPVLAAEKEAGTLVEPRTGSRFPAAVSFQEEGREYRLTATGVAARRVLFFDVYGMAHYLQEGEIADEQALLAQVRDDGLAKQASLQFARDLRADQIAETLRQTYAENAGPERLRETEGVLESFLTAIRKDVVEGERFVLRWLPGGRVMALYDGRVVSDLRSATFAEVLWSMWFGDRPIVDRAGLLALRRGGGG